MRIWPTILVVLSLITHLLFFGHPRSVVFDETFHGNFISQYSTGNYFFDIHPPLARLLIKTVGDIAGVDYNMDFSAIGNVLTDDVLVLRILPLIAGILLPLIIYLICRRLNISEVLSFIAGLLVIFENSILVQSKFILFDSILILFGFTSLLLYLMYIKNESKKSLLVWSAVFATATFSVKWTGLAFPLLIAIFELIRGGAFSLKKYIKFISVYAIVGIVLYFSIFAVHFSLLKNPGPGDAFMEQNFQEKGLVGKFIELNGEMYRANATLTATHQYASPWYSWPIMKRTVFYWQDYEAGEFIYFIGNPIVYWFGSLSVLFLLGYVGFKRKNLNKTSLFIFIGFLVNFLPFIFIGRVMFLYHYQAALVFSILAIIFALDLIKNHKKKMIISGSFVFICFLTFIYFAPLTYGLHLEKEELESKMWLKSWR